MMLLPRKAGTSQASAAMLTCVQSGRWVSVILFLMLFCTFKYFRTFKDLKNEKRLEITAKCSQSFSVGLKIKDDVCFLPPMVDKYYFCNSGSGGMNNTDI